MPNNQSNCTRSQQDNADIHQPEKGEIAIIILHFIGLRKKISSLSVLAMYLTRIDTQEYHKYDSCKMFYTKW